ncbi:hypothetical protein [uncultured Caulobacter sp.]|uniref:hypothetical protein n=1 Tax=uncultured Caulobacter sp. TaxID=158749 RepID=UPI0026047114|nr:hypothetical protein [uncultured Caulobacter sp.]
MKSAFPTSLFLAAVVSGGASAQAIPSRTPLATIPIAPSKTVTRVETTRVDFAPGQAMPRHKHTVPVICLVSHGAFRVKIGDAPERLVGLGEVTYEPPEVVVGYFRNSSNTDTAQLTCNALAGDADKTLNVMLPER